MPSLWLLEVFLLAGSSMAQESDLYEVGKLLKKAFFIGTDAPPNIYPSYGRRQRPLDWWSLLQLLGETSETGKTRQTETVYSVHRELDSMMATEVQLNTRVLGLEVDSGARDAPALAEDVGEWYGVMWGYLDTAKPDVTRVTTKHYTIVTTEITTKPSVTVTTQIETRFNTR